MVILICLFNLFFSILLFVTNSICSYYFTITNSWKFIVATSVTDPLMEEVFC